MVRLLMMSTVLKRAAELEVRYQNAITRQRRSIDQLLSDRAKLVAAIEEHLKRPCGFGTAGSPAHADQLRKVLDELAAPTD